MSITTQAKKKRKSFNNNNKNEAEEMGEWFAGREGVDEIGMPFHTGSFCAIDRKKFESGVRVRE